MEEIADGERGHRRERRIELSPCHGSSKIDRLVSQLYYYRCSAWPVRHLIIHRAANHTLEGRLITGFRVSTESDSSVTFAALRAHTDGCLYYRHENRDFTFSSINTKHVVKGVL